MMSNRNVFNVIKQNGDTVLFDEQKVQQSVVRALRTAHIQEQPIATTIVNDVMDKLADELSYREHITTLDVREAVEIALLERGLTAVAGLYHDYAKAPKEVIDQSDVDDSQVKKHITPSTFTSNKKITSKQHEVVTDSNQSKNNNKAHSKEKDIKTTQPVVSRNFSRTIPPEQNQVPVSISPTNIASKKPLPEKRNSVTYRFTLQDCVGYVTVSLFEDKSPGEILLHSIHDAEKRDVRVVHFFLSVISSALQHGVPLPALVSEIHASQEQLNLLADDAFGYVLLRHLLRWLSDSFTLID